MGEGGRQVNSLTNRFVFAWKDWEIERNSVFCVAIVVIVMGIGGAKR